MELSGSGITSGPSHCMPEVSGMAIGREMEQVRITVAPDMMGEGGDDVREIFAGSVYKDHVLYCGVILCLTLNK